MPFLFENRFDFTDPPICQYIVEKGLSNNFNYIVFKKQYT